MPLFGMASKVRKDPMGPATMGLLKNNADIARRLAIYEHISTGEHNAREVARVARRISGATVSPASTDITAVTNATAGTYVLTLAAGRFNATWMTCQINPCGADVANKPYLTGFQVISSTSIEVYLKQLTSALGFDPDGNSWSTGTNVDFDIAIHSETLAPVGYTTALPANSLIGDPLKPTKWNALVQNSADVQIIQTAEHSSGIHNTRQVASRSGLWRYNGATVALVAGVADSITVTRSLMGIYAVASSKVLNAETHCFVSPDYARLNSGDPADLFRMHCRQTSTTAWTVYVYKFNRSLLTWSLADGDFWLAMHGGNG